MPAVSSEASEIEFLLQEAMTGRKTLPVPDGKVDCVILSLAALIIERPTLLTAFKKLVPEVFDARLALGTGARARLNAMLLDNGNFHARLGKMISDTDDFVTPRHLPYTARLTRQLSSYGTPHTPTFLIWHVSHANFPCTAGTRALLLEWRGAVTLLARSDSQALPNPQPRNRASQRPRGVMSA